MTWDRRQLVQAAGRLRQAHPMVEPRRCLSAQRARSSDSTPAETLDRLDELLELEHRQLTLAAPSEAGDPDERRRPPWSPPAA